MLKIHLAELGKGEDQNDKNLQVLDQDDCRMRLDQKRSTLIPNFSDQSHHRDSITPS